MISERPRQVVITGVGLVTPLGKDPHEVWARIEAGESAQRSPTGFDASPFACRVCAEVPSFQPEGYVTEPKMLRLMNRDAKLAVAAAQLALGDARLRVGIDYAPEDIGLYGATGLAGMPWGEVTGLIHASASAEGHFDPQRFGRNGLRSINPLLSFKILSNMPVCFVSICANIRGSNAVYTPWEGQGAQAIESGFGAIRRGKAKAALVGGCDVKTHELAFITLEQQGLFTAWKERNSGTVPGEGAVFLVLEAESEARARGARLYARLAGAGFSTQRRGRARSEVYVEALQQAIPEVSVVISSVVAAADGDETTQRDEARALALRQLGTDRLVYPKQHAGNLFAAAAALQVGMAAVLVEKTGKRVVANCFGYGSEQAVFVLESP